MRSSTNSYTRNLRVLGVVLWLAACGGEDSSGGERDPRDDAGSSSEGDAASGTDAGGDAAAALDAGAPGDDAGSADASSPDASGADAGASDSDAAVGPDDDFAMALKTKLTACNLLIGSEPVQLDNQRSPTAVCTMLCLANASCAQLTSQYCAGSDTTLAACRSGCIFTCASGAALPSQDARCDGVPDCSDGSDETGCDDYYFTCDDGMQINIGQLCDGVRNCADYSDENICDNPFVCGGLILPRSAVCDLVRDCNDGADEVDCQFMCPAE